MLKRRARLPEYHAAFQLDGSGESISAARSRTREYLDQCEPPLPRDTAADALTLVSELVTNAVSHAPGPCCLYLVGDGEELTIAVSDSSVTEPVPRSPDLGGSGGFGWHLLRRLAKHVDVYVRPPWGKTVCATLRILAMASPAAAC